MIEMTRITAPDAWIDQVFAAKSVRTGGVIRRRIDWVEREIGRPRFEEEVRKRGFHLIETGWHLVIICHPGAVRLLF
ncbi:N-(5'-phosphoribosyl)anthranilate isomerase [Loktanella sp. 3ANDIMAR09]|uniref:hypothetical protein n=1 Tax=Loktanella sp. 3ANDIMAR09 TaxID=1225657 RepID=UPI0006FDD2EC|nr:hypothetical protein [Loktanella sp. 3ANDIMAR09]KQI69529.1 N-(5'-phosphoribosyl)anthranilate isomerase [Loktanella sp. 3ANDIMAR09]